MHTYGVVMLAFNVGAPFCVFAALMMFARAAMKPEGVAEFFDSIDSEDKAAKRKAIAGTALAVVGFGMLIYGGVSNALNGVLLSLCSTDDDGNVWSIRVAAALFFGIMGAFPAFRAIRNFAALHSEHRAQQPIKIQTPWN